MRPTGTRVSTRPRAGAGLLVVAALLAGCTEAAVDPGAGVTVTALASPTGSASPTAAPATPAPAETPAPSPSPVDPRSPAVPDASGLVTLVPDDLDVDAGFGASVATDGQTVVAGAPGAEQGRGAAYVFVRQGDGWAPTQKLTAQDDSPEPMQFGTAVAVDGGTLAVSAVGGPAHGVQVFVRRDGRFVPDTFLAPPPDSLGGFGLSLALDGATVVVGAPPDVEERGPGSVYVYEARQGGDLALSQTLVPPSPDANALFGEAVAVEATTIVVGAPSTVGEPGRAHVFGYAAGFRHEATLEPGPGGEGSLFGNAVAVRVSTDPPGAAVLVGAPGHDTNGDDAGAAFRFSRRDDGTWPRDREFHGETAGAWYGASVALADPDTAAVGIPRLPEPAVDLIVAQGRHRVAGPQGGYFGGAVAAAAGITAIGAPEQRADGLAGAGAVYVFVPPASR